MLVADWLPRYFTPRKSDQSDGEFVADFGATFLHVSKGVQAGGALVCTDWQRWLLDGIYEKRADGKFRFRRVVVGLPRKNGKSLLGSLAGIYGLIEGEAGAEVYAAAGDRQQARVVFNEAKWQITNSPELSGICKVYRDVIEVPATGAIFRVLSSDAKLQQGLNPSTVIFDELHVQPNDDLWDALTMGSGARVSPMIIGITTAGFDLESLCGRLYNYGKSVAAGDVDDPAFGFYWWEAPADCSLDDRSAWYAANPNLPIGLMDEEDMETSIQQSGEAAVRRYRFNQWVRTSGECWLPKGAWESCTGSVVFDPDEPCFVGVDMALKHDSIAVVLAQPQGDRIAVQARIWHPDIEGMDVAGVEEHLRQLHRDFNVVEFAYDPAFFQRSAEALFDDGLPMLEFPQNGQRMIPACGTTYELIVASKIIHDGSPMFTDQVLSAAQRMTDNGWRLSKGKSRRKIDACIAMVMAVDRASRKQEPPPAPPMFFS
jgi:phage terminase large subunit-like protein